MSGNHWPPERRTPFGAYYFEVEIKGTVYPFKSCGGLKIEQAVVEVEEGGFNSSTRKLPGRTKWSNIVLKMGFCGADSPLYALKRKIMNDAPNASTSSDAIGWTSKQRFSGTITQKGPNGAVAKWMFRNGWICKWEGPDLDASKNEVSIEAIEIAHEGLAMLPADYGQSSGAGGGGGGSSAGQPSGPDGGDGSDESEEEG
jgi:phage tail-like protein